MLEVKRGGEVLEFGVVLDVFRDARVVAAWGHGFVSIWLVG